MAGPCHDPQKKKKPSLAQIETAVKIFAGRVGPPPIHSTLKRHKRGRCNPGRGARRMNKICFRSNGGNRGQIFDAATEGRTEPQCDKKRASKWSLPTPIIRCLCGSSLSSPIDRPGTQHKGGSFQQHKSCKAARSTFIRHCILLLCMLRASSQLAALMKDRGAAGGSQRAWPGPKILPRSCRGHFYPLQFLFINLGTATRPNWV